MKKLTLESLRRIIREEIECMSQGSMRVDDAGMTTRPDPLADLYDDDMLPEDPLDDINCVDCGEYLDVDGSCPACGPHPPSRRMGESRSINEASSSDLSRSYEPGSKIEFNLGRESNEPYKELFAAVKRAIPKAGAMQAHKTGLIVNYKQGRRSVMRLQFSKDLQAFIDDWYENDMPVPAGMYTLHVVQ